MPFKCEYNKYTLHFKFNAGTSRGFLKERTAYFIRMCDSQQPDRCGLGECSPLQGLSPDARPDLEKQLYLVCSDVETSTLPELESEIDEWLDGLVGEAWPALRFGLETAWRDYSRGGRRQIVNNDWSVSPHRPIPINGLVWMGDPAFMQQQIDEKLEAGFSCIKLKIGAIDFEQELSLLASIRQRYDARTITLRVDANGAFLPQEALKKLDALSRYDIHSIEQPIQPHQPEAMHRLCRESPVPIALDEELIGVTGLENKRKLLEQIKPPFVVLKPTLLGGLSATEAWIDLAQQQNIGWWITSALESNIGLNAIAQLTASCQVDMPQGLGTGQLYHNNVPSPLYIDRGHLRYATDQKWGSI